MQGNLSGLMMGTSVNTSRFKYSHYNQPQWRTEKSSIIPSVESRTLTLLVRYVVLTLISVIFQVLREAPDPSLSGNTNDGTGKKLRPFFPSQTITTPSLPPHTTPYRNSGPKTPAPIRETAPGRGKYYWSSSFLISARKFNRVHVYVTS